jgi:HK97 family phage major capsid protein
MNRHANRRLFEMVRAIPRGIETKEGPDLETQIKSIRDEIIAKVGGNVEQVDKMQKQLDALDCKLAQRHIADAGGAPSLVDTLKGNDAVARLVHDRRGRAVIELDEKQTARIFHKSTLTTGASASLSTTGVLQIDRMTGITAEARQELTTRNVLSSAPTTFQVVDFVKVDNPLVNASPQVEGSGKFENAVTFTAVSERVKTIATFIRASRQIMEDMTELASFLDTGLTYYVNQAEEIELLSGSAAGEHLNGLIRQATSFSTGLLSASKGWNTLDIIGRAIQQITTAKEIAPTFVILHPTDWWAMRLTKDSYGRYILGDPQSDVAASLFGLTVVSTTNIAAGTFLLGSGNPAASQIRDRMTTVVDISTEDANNFTTNLVTVRCEKRLALVVRRPASYITGSFTSSPA